MANSVDIEVQLTGAEQAKRGLKGIGETAGKMAGHFDKFNEHLGEGIGEVVGNVEELGGTFKELGSTIKGIGKGGATSLLGLIPGVMGVVGAGFALFETFQMITGATQEAEEAQESMGAASADLQSKLEALAEQGVIPSAEAMVKFTEATLTAQFAKDRLEKSYQKLSPLLEEQANLESKIHDLREENETKLKGQYNLTEANKKTINELVEKQLKNEKKITEEVARYRRVQLAVQKDLKAAAKEEEKLSELSFESTMSRIKKSAETVLALEKEQKIREGIDDFQRKTFALQADRDAELLNLKINALEEENIEEARALEKQLKAREESIDKKLLIEQRYNEQYKKLSEEEQAIFDNGEAKKRASFAATKARQLMLEQRTQQEIFALRALEIQHLKQLGADEMEILSARYQLEIDQAGDSANRRLMAEMRFEMAKTNLVKSEEAKRQAEIDKRQAKIIRQIDEQNQKIKDQVDLGIAAIPIIGGLAEAFASGFAEASFGALAMGESFQDSMIKIIQGLGKQAAVQALLETGKGVAALILNPALAASHFKSAAIFGGAATLAGVSASALGGGGGGGGGASPSGAPQTAPTPQRETAQETSAVFNINFGGAVIYDTKQAAERAMVDRLVGVINQRNRGSRRLNLGSV